MLNRSVSQATFRVWLWVFVLFVLFALGVSQSQLTIAADTSYTDNTSKNAEKLRLEYLEELAKEYDKIYNSEFARNPDDIPINEYEGGTDRYFGDLVLRGDELILEVSSGKLLVITRNEHQEQLKQQLIKFVSEHSDVPVRVGIQGLINTESDNDLTAESLDELVLVNYNGLEANATHNLFKAIKALNDEE